MVFVGIEAFQTPLAPFLDLFLRISSSLHDLEPLRFRKLVFVVDFVALAFAKPVLLKLISLILGDGFLDPLGNLPGLDQSIVDLLVGKVSLGWLLLLNGFDPLLSVFFEVPIGIHLLEHLEFLVVSRDHFIELLIVVDFFLVFFFVVVVAVLLVLLAD